MDLLARVIGIALVVIVILIVLYYALQGTLFQHVTEQQAEALVQADLQRTYPAAILNITNVTPSAYAGSWHIAASVITNSTSPCPSYTVYTFDYPQFGFVSRVDNAYTNNCKIYGLATNKTFIISSFPVAITRSYTLNVPAVKDFVNSYGFDNVSVLARFLNNVTALGTVYNNVWLVNYSSTRANYSVYVLLTLVNGSLITAYNRSR